MSNVTPLRHDSPLTARSLVADEVRGLLAKRRIHISHLPETLGNSREFWRRRLVVGDVPLDIDNLAQLAGLLGVEIADLIPADAPVTPSPAANRQPSD